MALTKIDDRGLKTPVDLLDNEKIRFGTGNDLEIYHDGSHSFIKDAGTGNLILRTNYLNFQSANGLESTADFSENGAVRLYYDGAKKFETISTGAKVTGNLHLDGGSSGTDAYIYTNNAAGIVFQADENGHIFQTYASGGWQTRLTITDAGNVRVPDNGKFTAGASDDLKLYHDSTNTYITNSTGQFAVQGDDLKLRSTTDLENYIVCTYNGAVDLYHNGSKKLETNSTGAKVYGSLQVDSVLDISPPGSNAVLIKNPANGIMGFGTNNVSNQVTITTDGHLGIPNDTGKLRLGASEDLQIYHDGGGSKIVNSTGDLQINNSGGDTWLASNGVVRISNNSHDGYMAKFDEDGAVELYYDGSKKFETYSNGLKLNAQNNVWIQDNGKLVLGGGSDLQIYHDGNNTWLKNSTGQLKFETADSLQIFGSNSETLADFHKDGACNLYYDNTKKLETTANGIAVTGRIEPTDHIFMDASYGIVFDPYGASGANLLDDYEEGTFTPAWNTGSAASAMFDSCSYSATAGKYTKIGDCVTFSVRIQCGSVTNANSGSHVILTSLPFTSQNNDGWQGGGAFNYAQAFCQNNNGVIPTIHVGGNTSALKFYQLGGSDYTVGDSNNDFTDTLHIHGHYYVA